MSQNLHEKHDPFCCGPFEEECKRMVEEGSGKIIFADVARIVIERAKTHRYIESKKCNKNLGVMAYHRYFQKYFHLTVKYWLNLERTRPIEDMAEFIGAQMMIFEMLYYAEFGVPAWTNDPVILKQQAKISRLWTVSDHKKFRDKTWWFRAELMNQKEKNEGHS